MNTSTESLLIQLRLCTGGVSIYVIDELEFVLTCCIYKLSKSQLSQLGALTLLLQVIKDVNLLNKKYSLGVVTEQNKHLIAVILFEAFVGYGVAESSADIEVCINY